MVYNSNKCYEELFIRNKEVSIHQKQLSTFATEIYKSLRDVNPDLIKNYFKIKEVPYSLEIPSTLSIFYRTFSNHFCACLLWNKLTNL